jgi:hypothetical protein
MKFFECLHANNNGAFTHGHVLLGALPGLRLVKVARKRSVTQIRQRRHKRPRSEWFLR